MCGASDQLGIKYTVPAINNSFLHKIATMNEKQEATNLWSTAV